MKTNFLKKHWMFLGGLTSLLLGLASCGGGSSSSPPPPTASISISKFAENPITIGESTTATISLTNASVYNKNVSVVITPVGNVALLTPICTLTVAKSTCSVQLFGTDLSSTTNPAGFTIKFNNGASEQTLSSSKLIIGHPNWQKVGQLPPGGTKLVVVLPNTLFAESATGVYKYNTSTGLWDSIGAMHGNVTYMTTNLLDTKLLIGTESGFVYQYIPESFAPLQPVGNGIASSNPISVIYSDVTFDTKSGSAFENVYAGDESGQVQYLRIESSASWAHLCTSAPTKSIVALTSNNLGETNSQIAGYSLYASVNNGTASSTIFACSGVGGTWSPAATFAHGNIDTMSAIYSINESGSGNIHDVYATTIDNKIWKYDTTTQVWSELLPPSGTVTYIALQNTLAFAAQQPIYIGLSDGSVWHYSHTNSAWTQLGNPITGSSAISFLSTSFIEALSIYAITNDGSMWWTSPVLQ